MPLRRHVCRLPLRINAPKNHVWISEDVLDNAMYRFACGKTSRRHVGITPGPLESRKRATKRRMMNFAQVGAGAEIDPSVLPGMYTPERAEWKWQSPTPALPLKPEEPKPLPSWLANPRPIEADECLEKPEKLEDIEGTDNVEDQVEQQHTDHCEQVGSDHHVISGQFMEVLINEKDQLMQALTAEHEQAPEAIKGHRKHKVTKLQASLSRKIEDIRRTAETLPRSLRRKDLQDISIHRVSELILPQLCYAGEPLSALLSALEDTALGTPGALSFLLNWQLEKSKGEGRLRNQIKLDDMILLQQWMRRQLYLGLKGEEEILVFLRFIAHVNEATQDESLKCSLIVSITEGLQSSLVFGFKDLGQGTQYKLLESIARGPVTRQSLRLGFGLIEAMRQLQIEATDHMISAFVAQAVFANASLRENQKLEAQYMEVIPMLLEVVESLPGELACSVMLLTTKILIKKYCRMPAVKAAKIQIPHIWWSALAKTHLLKPVIEVCLSTHELEIAIPYLRQLDDRDQARLILRYWFGPRTKLGQARAQDLFEGFCSAKAKESPWVSMFQAVRHCVHLSLCPAKTDVRQVFKGLQMLGKSKAIVEIIKQIRKLRSIINKSDVVYIIREHLKTAPNIAEQIFRFDRTLRLEECPELAERMILDPRSRPVAARYYMQKRRTPFPVDREKFSQARIQLLERMALAYSLASHMTPRMALRNVQICHTQHIEEGLGLPSVVMARALTRAGLIRRLEAGEWVSTTLVRRVLPVIRSTEGAEVADKVDETVFKWRGANVKRFR